MSTAFVLSGGASLGAVQVGMLRALVERGITPDLLVGTSAGALNAAFLAGHGTTPAAVDELAAVWRGLQARLLFPLDPLRALAALAGRRTSLCSDRGLRHLLEQHLTFDRLEDAPVPVVVVATDLLTGRDVALSEGDAHEAVLASCALPAVFPPVPHEGRQLVDGGLANNTALSEAVRAGVSTIYALPSGYSCALPRPPRTPLGTAVHALEILTHQRLLTDVERYADQVDLVVLPPPCPLSVSPANFGRAGELIDAAHATAAAALDVDRGRRTHPERNLGLHDHSAAGVAGTRA
ncbi:MAG TPA: patatin-like phospholipase family protein [Marmoricola sp.]